MQTESFPSKLLETAVAEFSKLPGIGRKTALRLVLHLLKKDASKVRNFGESIITLRENVKYCKVCRNISDTDICNICSDPSRDSSLICVVENIKDVMAIENTSQYKGLYHVIGGIISPIDGIGPKDLEIDSLIDRVENDSVSEVILALSTTMDGDTTGFYINRKLDTKHIAVSVLARGVSIGDELEYIDEITLGRSLMFRTPFENSYS